MNKPVAFHTFKHGRFDITVLSEGPNIPLNVTTNDGILVDVGAGTHFQPSPVMEARS